MQLSTFNSQKIKSGIASAMQFLSEKIQTTSSKLQNIKIEVDSKRERVKFENTRRLRSLNGNFKKQLHALFESKYLNRNVLASAAAVPLVTQGEQKVLDAADLTAKVIEPIPEPPPIPTEEVLNQLNALGEPTFASLGLGGWTPVGMVQQAFEYFHVTLGIPWWEAILIGTIIIRICMFPLVIISQRNAAKMNNYLPQMQALQLRMTEARQSGNHIETARYSQELMLFMKEKGLNPFKNMIVPLAQMPVFISFFVGLRQMSNTPVESLREGGMWWFTDLTVPDQFYALPIITSLTLWATIEVITTFNGNAIVFFLYLNFLGWN